MKTINFRNFHKPTIFVLCLFASLQAFSQQKKWTVPAANEKLVNPIQSTSEILKDAKTIYITNCGPCHGKSGKGDGIAAVSLNPKPADHTSAALANETDGALFWKLSEGRNSMPGFKSSLSEKQRWELVDFIRSLAAKK